MPNKVLPIKGESEKRSFSVADFRAVDEEKIIEGHAAVFEQKTNIGGYFYEIIERGAFDGCDFDDVLFSVNHDLRKIPIARSRRNNGNSTMQIQVDEKGLYIKARPDIEENADARALYSSIKRGDMDGMSLIFHVKEERWENLDKEMPTRHILKFRKVREVSAVTMPAYSGTDINVRDQEALDNASRVLDNARSELDNSQSEQAESLKIKNQNIILAKEMVNF